MSIRFSRNTDMTRGRFQSGPRSVCSSSGFTLMELLLVVVIILIVTGLAIPSFVQSYRSSKLRSSIRTLIMANRYARSTAVLQQVQTSILFDVAKSSLEVVAVEALIEKEDDMFLEGTTGPGQEDEPVYTVNTKLERTLPDGIKILAVLSDLGVKEKDGIYFVEYYPNGMCDQYSVQLQDDRKQRVEVAIDPLSGRTEVEYGL